MERCPAPSCPGAAPRRPSGSMRLGCVLARRGVLPPGPPGTQTPPRRLYCGGPGLRRQAVQVPGEQRDLPDVLGPGQPAGPALEPESSACRTAATGPGRPGARSSPPTRTGLPGTADGSSAASVRDRPASAVVTIITSSSAGALEVRAGARSRCHRTLAGVSRPRRPLRGRRPELGRCLRRRPAVRLHCCRRLSERRDAPVTRSSVITRDQTRICVAPPRRHAYKPAP